MKFCNVRCLDRTTRLWEYWSATNEDYTFMRDPVRLQQSHFCCLSEKESCCWMGMVWVAIEFTARELLAPPCWSCRRSTQERYWDLVTTPFSGYKKRGSLERGVSPMAASEEMLASWRQLTNPFGLTSTGNSKTMNHIPQFHPFVGVAKVCFMVRPQSTWGRYCSTEKKLSHDGESCTRHLVWWKLILDMGIIIQGRNRWQVTGGIE